ncbi:hypothetical protein N9B94_01065, partial [Verrucomicrobia bacterium]|nr:hypothetical protein [Verrucomicrobiota bacterium]
FNILRASTNRSFPRRYFTTYSVETEPGIRALVYRLSDNRHISRPPINKSKRAYLYISHHSADQELRTNKALIAYIKKHPDDEIFTVDLRGIGESRPNTANPNSFLSPYGSDYLYAAHSVMLNRPYVGQKTHDLLRVIDFLAQSGSTDLTLHANGWGSIPGIFGTLQSPNVKSLKLENPLESFHQLATTEHYNWPLSALVPNILRQFDIPDCLAAIKQRGTKTSTV